MYRNVGTSADFLKEDDLFRAKVRSTNTLWWTNIAMENHHAINGKIHYFNGHFQLLFVGSPEGRQNMADTIRPDPRAARVHLFTKASSQDWHGHYPILKVLISQHWYLMIHWFCMGFSNNVFFRWWKNPIGPWCFKCFLMIHEGVTVH